MHPAIVIVVRGKYAPPPPSPIICTRVKPNGLYYVDIKIYIGDDARRGCCIRYPHTVVVARGKYAPPLMSKRDKTVKTSI